MNGKTYEKVVSWKAFSSQLDIMVSLEPWGKYVSYHRVRTMVNTRIPHQWVWREGTYDSQSTVFAPEEVQDRLSKLVLCHDELGLFCKLYGIAGFED